MSLLELKEQNVVPATALLCELTLSDGSQRFWATARCVDGTIHYQARIHPDQLSVWRLTADVTSESTGQVSVTFADNDAAIAQLFQTGKLLGARVRFYAAVLDGRTVTSKTVLLSGLLDTVSELDGKSARLNVLSRLSAMRSSFPPMRIQKQCSWAFPANAEQRLLAVSSGEDGRYSPLFRCGYSPDQVDGVGNLNGGEPFTSCDFSRTSCEARGMFSRDSANRVTQRFSGIEFVPPTYQVRGHGESSGRLSNLVQIDTQYNDVVPAVYGMGWLQAPVVFARNDGNLTRCEVLLGLGEIEGVVKVVADGYEIPEGMSGQNMTGTGWYNLISKGNRTGALNGDLKDAAGNPVGDPYASMAYLNLVLPNKINDGKKLPKVEVLLKGMKLPVLDAEGALSSYEWSANPAWILCDILRRTGWRLDELDLSSFINAANFCNVEITARDANGVERQVKRFESNLVLRRRYSVGELLRSLRIGSLLFLYFQPDGRLAVRPETSIALQQPALPAGSNATGALNGGWPVYEFGDGITESKGILLKSNWDADFRVYSKPSLDSPNRVSFEIQDSLNEFQQDSISIADTEDIRLRRQEIAQALPVTGVPNFPQAQRICQTWLNKSIQGNVYLEFRTSVRGFHVRPGDLITITSERYGFERTMFRVLEFQLSPRLDVMKVICQLHQDHWYSDNAQIRYDRSRIYAWRSTTARAVCGTRITDGQIVFDASESLGVSPEGFDRCVVTIPFRKPQTEVGAASGVPLVSFAYTVQTTGGTLPPGSYFYGVTTVDDQGRESGLSSLIPVRIGGSSTTNRVTISGISAAAGAVGLNLYRGNTPQRLVRVRSSWPVGDTITDQGDTLEAQVPPDSNYNRLRAWYRQIFVTDQAPTAWTTTTITRADMNLVDDQWIGKKLILRSGKGRGQERNIVSHTDDTITIDRPWDVLPDATSRFAIVDTAWTFSTETESDIVQVMLPLLPTYSFDISLRSVSKNDAELDALEAPSLVWQVGIGSPSTGDTGVPPKPSFGLGLVEEGTVSITGISFPTPTNLATVFIGQLGILFWDEQQAPTPVSLVDAIDDLVTNVKLAGLPALLAEGDHIQIDEEIFRVTGAPIAPDTYPVERARYQTFAATHTASTAVFVLTREEMTIPFVPGYFTTSAASGFRFNFRMPNVRISAADLTLYNRVGPSERGEANYTGFTNFGIRTLSGGQITMNLSGYLAIESSAGNSYVLDRLTVVRDVSAYVQEPPAGANVEIMVRINGDPLCELLIEAGSHVATAVNRFNQPALPAGGKLSFDILNVPPASVGTPGRDLTILLQI